MYQPYCHCCSEVNPLTDLLMGTCLVCGCVVYLCKWDCKDQVWVQTYDCDDWNT